MNDNHLTEVKVPNLNFYFADNVPVDVVEFMNQLYSLYFS